MRWLKRLGGSERKDRTCARERHMNDNSAILAREMKAIREENDRILARERQALIDENASILAHDRSSMEAEINLYAMDRIKRVYYEMARTKAELARLKDAICMLTCHDTDADAVGVIAESAKSWQEALQAQSSCWERTHSDLLYKWIAPTTSDAEPCATPTPP